MGQLIYCMGSNDYCLPYNDSVLATSKPDEATMKDKQADWCPDLADYSGPKYRALVAAMQRDIQNGTLPPGTKLPTQRDLAWSLKVNLSTVTEAFREATRLRLITGEVGRGTYILPGNDAVQLYAIDKSAKSDVIDLSTIVPAPAFTSDDIRKSFSALLSRAICSKSWTIPPLISCSDVAVPSPNFISRAGFILAKAICFLVREHKQHCLRPFNGLPNRICRCS